LSFRGDSVLTNEATLERMVQTGADGRVDIQLGAANPAHVEDRRTRPAGPRVASRSPRPDSVFNA
jgi:hypothetical protein